jgi:hypothetical protein
MAILTLLNAAPEKLSRDGLCEEECQKFSDECCEVTPTKAPQLDKDQTPDEQLSDEEFTYEDEELVASGWFPVS